MLTRRIIPCLDVHAGRVVKGVNFVDLRDAGDPVEIAKAYNAQGADEITFLDITASSDDRGIMEDVVARTAEQVFIPLTVGGGIRTAVSYTHLDVYKRQRPDLTGPIARAAATKLLIRQDVLRLCYIQNAFGFFNRGIAGKTEFTQAGVELIGKQGADADAEVIALAIGTLRKIGLEGFKIELGQVAYFKGLIEGRCV